MIHARLRYARISPRKVRLVARVLPGLPVADAEASLRYLAPRGAAMLLKLLRSAVANAKENFHLGPEDLVVQRVVVGSGAVLRRSMPRARGSAYRIEKKTSHIDLVLMERGEGRGGREAGERVEKTADVITRDVADLSREELREDIEKRGGRGPRDPGGAVRRTQRARSARQLTERRLSGQ